MMDRSVSGKESFPRRSNVSVPDIGQNGGCSVWIMLHDAGPQLVCGAFKAQGEQWPVFGWKALRRSLTASRKETCRDFLEALHDVNDPA
jgi:hypothetical protein